MPQHAKVGVARFSSFCLQFSVSRRIPKSYVRQCFAVCSSLMKGAETSIFEQQYRVVAVESDRLLVRGILSGEVLTTSTPSLRLLLHKKTIRLEN